MRPIAGWRSNNQIFLSENPEFLQNQNQNLDPPTPGLFFLAQSFFYFFFTQSTRTVFLTFAANYSKQDDNNDTQPPGLYEWMAVVGATIVPVSLVICIAKLV